ncbi:hypothetical protein ABR737_00130 [Streptomyces sp. Edi2]|uniref:hypothetical protein n=1 Tax=Streptomyces sp. Edi2 TaxID=3162528 RepID=UPI003306732D
MPDDHDALRDQIFAETKTLVDNLELLLGPEFLEQAMQLRWQLENAARISSLILHSDDDNEAAGKATELVCALFPGETPIPDSWWSTPLGRACAMTAGHPTAEHVSYSVAGAMLGGITRQRISTLADEGKLDRHPDGGVTVVSVQQRLRNQTPPR